MSDTTIRSFRLTDAGDLDITGGTLTKIAGIEAARQEVRAALQFFLKEWFLDETEGTPFFDKVLVKNPNPAVLQSVFRARILSRPSIKSVDTLVLTFDRQARKLQLDFQATCDFGVFDDSVTLTAAQ